MATMPRTCGRLHENEKREWLARKGQKRNCDFRDAARHKDALAAHGGDFRGAAGAVFLAHAN
jgi:hypothetical protein